jgi:hypothetical protein
MIRELGDLTARRRYLAYRLGRFPRQVAEGLTFLRTEIIPRCERKDGSAVFLKDDNAVAEALEGIDKLFGPGKEKKESATKAIRNWATMDVLPPQEKDQEIEDQLAEAILSFNEFLQSPFREYSELGRVIGICMTGNSSLDDDFSTPQVRLQSLLSELAQIDSRLEDLVGFEPSSPEGKPSDEMLKNFLAWRRESYANLEKKIEIRLRKPYEVKVWLTGNEAIELAVLADKPMSLPQLSKLCHSGKAPFTWRNVEKGSHRLEIEYLGFIAYLKTCRERPDSDAEPASPEKKLIDKTKAEIDKKKGRNY